MAAEFRPELILDALHRHEVRYILIGGLAATIHGAAHVTFDADITPERSASNLERLSAALEELHARIRAEGEPSGVPFRPDAAFLAGVEVWNFITDHGPLDIAFMPAGTHGYEDLRRDAIHLTVLGVEVDVASLADVVRSKEAAGRQKDLQALPTLRRLLDEGGGTP